MILFYAIGIDTRLAEWTIFIRVNCTQNKQFFWLKIRQNYKQSTCILFTNVVINYFLFYFTYRNNNQHMTHVIHRWTNSYNIIYIIQPTHVKLHIRFDRAKGMLPWQISSSGSHLPVSAGCTRRECGRVATPASSRSRISRTLGSEEASETRASPPRIGSRGWAAWFHLQRRRVEMGQGLKFLYSLSSCCLVRWPMILERI